MKYLNAQQLAFILDIKREDARAKMCNAWCKAHGIENEFANIERDHKNKIKDGYPLAMPIEILSTHLNLPTLQLMVDDIVEKYLIRAASRKWILCNYPEKIIKKSEETGEVPKVSIPPALKSMLHSETQRTILEEWEKRYKLSKRRPKQFTDEGIIEYKNGLDL